MNYLFEDGKHSFNAVGVALISIFYMEDGRSRVLMLVRVQVFPISIFSVLKKSIRKEVVNTFSQKAPVKTVVGVQGVLQLRITCRCIIYNLISLLPILCLFEVLNVKSKLIISNAAALILHFIDAQYLTTPYERCRSFRDGT